MLIYFWKNVDIYFVVGRSVRKTEGDIVGI